MSGLIGMCAGCASPVLNTKADSELAGAIAACYNAQSASELALIEKFQNSMEALNFYLSKRLGDAAGTRNPCESIKTSNDVQIVAMQENTKRTESWLGFGGKALGYGLIGYGIYKFADVAKAWSDNTGYNLTSNGDMNLSDSIHSSYVGGNSHGKIMNQFDTDLDITSILE